KPKNTNEISVTDFFSAADCRRPRATVNLLTRNNRVTIVAAMADYVSLQDAELIAACLNQDAEAWETLVRRYQRLIASNTA
ncbi:MAG TPA: hypothetical protein PLD20_28560, partial [Blastocatellia bacterium]|nr:hypothetical protein [Blastocatellia bacterium]